MTHAITYADPNLAAFVRACLSEGITLEQAERLLEMTFEEVAAWEFHRHIWGDPGTSKAEEAAP